MARCHNALVPLKTAAGADYTPAASTPESPAPARNCRTARILLRSTERKPARAPCHPKAPIKPRIATATPPTGGCAYATVVALRPSRKPTSATASPPPAPFWPQSAPALMHYEPTRNCPKGFKTLRSLAFLRPCSP